MVKDSSKKKLLEHLTTALLVLDDQLQVIYMNPAAESMFQISELRQHELNVAECFGGGEKLQETLESLHPFSNREAEVRNHIGHKMTVNYTVTPLLEPGEPIRLLVELECLDRILRISRDETLMNNHQATRALIRGVAHEVKNPLGGIRGAAQLLARELRDDDLSDYTNVIIEESDRLRNLVDSMLGPHKQPKHDTFNIHEVLERVRTIISVEAGDALHIERDYDPSLPDLIGDQDQMIQAVLNIVRNAWQVLKENGALNGEPRIWLKTRALRQFTIGSVKHRIVTVLEITDNGPGIKEDLIEQIFYPLVSSRAQGTGLGLSISQSIVTQHNGIIECDSKPGETTFKIILPLEQYDEHAK